jgi:hypothetical protein
LSLAFPPAYSAAVSDFIIVIFDVRHVLKRTANSQIASNDDSPDQVCAHAQPGGVAVASALHFTR